MKLGIMQPYFFPYLGYFDLINYTDEWIVFDTAQYIRHGWVNRNRILHPVSGSQFVIAPVQKHQQQTAIKDVLVAEDGKWRHKITAQLHHYCKYAPYYGETIALVEDCLNNEQVSLSCLNVSILERICKRLEINFRYRYFSGMNLQLGPVEGPGDWALRISEALGADGYVNPPGGRSLFNPLKFEKANVRLVIREFPNMRYETQRYQFEPALSIVDVLMWNEPAKITDYLNQLV